MPRQKDWLKGLSLKKATVVLLLCAVSTAVFGDITEDIKRYTKDCDGGSAGGCYNLGVLYESGIDVEQDKAKAVALYTKACNGRSAAACSNLGVMYYIGNGVRQDRAKAKALFGKACSLHSEVGCRNYAIGF
jgi:TPR repeat protein